MLTRVELRRFTRHRGHQLGIQSRARCDIARMNPVEPERFPIAIVRIQTERFDVIAVDHEVLVTVCEQVSAPVFASRPPLDKSYTIS